jgi:hypothetical protein
MGKLIASQGFLPDQNVVPGGGALRKDSLIPKGSENSMKVHLSKPISRV